MLDSYEKQLKRYEEILRLRRRRLTLKEIGEKFGVSHQAIQQRLAKGKPKEVIRKYESGFSRFEGRDRTRELVRRRDNYTCQNCGVRRTREEVDSFNSTRKKGEKKMFSLDVHHLNGICGKKTKKYDVVLELDGMITLCHKCHYNHPQHTRNLKELRSPKETV